MSNSRAWALATCLLTLSIAGEASAQAYPVVSLDYPIVYVRCPRSQEWTATAEVTVGGERVMRSRTFDVTDGPDRMPEVTRFYGGFQAGCDLMLRHPGGDEEVIYDCGSRPEEDACSAMDPAVSFDGARIAFAVFHGRVTRARQNTDSTLFDPAADPEPVPVTWPNPLLRASGAHMLVYDVESRETAEITPYTEGIWDSGPAWLSTGRIAFTSNRQHVFRTLIHGSDPASQIYTVDPDGENIEVASHHSLGAEQHPYQLRDGRVAYSSWQLFGMLPYRTSNGGTRNAGSTPNKFHLYVQSPDGAEPFALYGQHGTNPNMASVAAHFLTQDGTGRVWGGVYYRANNNGLANIHGLMPPPEGQEGYGPHELEALPVPYWERSRYLYYPRDAMIIAPWSAGGSDLNAPVAEPPFEHPNYADPLRNVGKLGFPASVPEGMLLSWGLGRCHIRTLARAAIPADSASGVDNPACDLGIYRTRAVPSTSPADLERVVDSREYHEIFAKPVIPYSDLFGVEQPDVIERAEIRYRGTPGLEPGSPFGMLGASSLIYRETGHHSIGRDGVVPIPFAFQSHSQLARVGGDLIRYDDDEICGVRILGVMPNREEDEREGNGSRLGERVVILGEVPARHREGGAPIIDSMGNPDTSFLLRMPANMPYLMQSVDCDGRALSTDQVWQSVRPGEKKVCGGCHVHSQESMPFEGTVASRDDFVPARLGEGYVPLMDGLDADGDVVVREVEGQGLAVQLERDVMPILERRCASCHGETDPAGGLRLDDADEVVRCVFRDADQSCVPEARRVPGAREGRSTLDWPNYSYYARFMNARGSLLYWKATNRRTDGIADDERESDIDFGADHPTEITPEELDTLAMWIELGGPVGPRYLHDTQPPTLNVFGQVEGGALVSFRLGTTDLGTGVDVSSLSVCQLEGDGCAWTETPEAAPHGIVDLSLPAPVTEPSTRFRFTVLDAAGNERTFVRNARWFFALAIGWEDGMVPPLPGPDGGAPVPRTDGSLPGADGGTGEETVMGDCACRAAPGKPSRWPVGLALGSVLLALRTRRRRSRRAQ